MLALAKEAAAQGAHLVAFPEMFLTGYPVEDLALRPSFVRPRAGPRSNAWLGGSTARGWATSSSSSASWTATSVASTGSACRSGSRRTRRP